MNEGSFPVISGTCVFCGFVYRISPRRTKMSSVVNKTRQIVVNLLDINNADSSQTIRFNLTVL